MFGLTGRYIDNPKDYHELPAIDYYKVDSILASKRKEALEYLTNNLQ